MAGSSSRNKVNIGITSLILIFIVLCLSTFALLSLSSAKGDLNLAERNARAVTGYYEADTKGQQWVAEQNRKFQAGKPVSTDIPVGQGQSLHIDLVEGESHDRYEIGAWYIYDSGEFEIDSRLQVWTGSEDVQGQEEQK